jgi:ankyrin repeat protein
MVAARPNTATTQIAQLILSHPDVEVNGIDECGDTPLHIAVTFRNYEVVKLLLEHDADPRGLNEVGDTVLHTAVKSTPVKNPKIVIAIVEYMKQKGIDYKTIKDNEGLTPDDVAKNLNKHFDCLK